MEIPASLLRLRVRTAKGDRALNATELSLAVVVYGHAVITHEQPRCTLTYETITAIVGRGHREKLRRASQVLERAGYWTRSTDGQRFVWSILVRPNDDGHRWVDARVPPPDPAPHPIRPPTESGGPPDQTGTTRSGGDPPTGSDGGGPPDPVGTPPPDQTGGDHLIRPPISEQIRNDQESDQNSDQGREPEPVFQLAPSPPTRSPPAKAGHRLWDTVMAGYAEARQIAGMPPQWGRYRDNPTTRGHVARIERDGYTAEDVTAVFAHIGRGLADGSFGDPKWAALEYVARAMERYVQQIAAGGARTHGKTRGIDPLCTPIARPPPKPDATPEPEEYYPENYDDWMTG